MERRQAMIPWRRALAVCGWLVVAMLVAVLAGAPAYAAEPPQTGTKNFTPPGYVPNYFSNESAPLRDRASVQTAPSPARPVAAGPVPRSQQTTSSRHHRTRVASARERHRRHHVAGRRRAPARRHVSHIRSAHRGGAHATGTARADHQAAHHRTAPHRVVAARHGSAHHRSARGKAVARNRPASHKVKRFARARG